MPIQIEEGPSGKLIFIHLKDTLKEKDYAELIPEFERLVRLHGKLRVLLHMSGFHGWEVSAAWKHFKFVIHHFSDIERIAVVGEQRWQERMATFARAVTKLFTKVTVRYFDRAGASAARSWLEQA